jgi:tight adherence protein C
MTPSVLLALVAGPLLATGIADLAAARARAPRMPRGRRRLGPAATAALARLGRRVGAPRPSRDLAARLAAADAPMSMADAMAAKAGSAVAGLLGSLPLAASAPGRLGLVLPAAAGAGAFAGVDVWLRVRARRRASRMAAELPDVADLLRVATQAGLPPTRALAEVARRHRGLLAGELGRAAAQAALGRPRAEALEELRRRAPLPGVAALTAALERANRLGTPLAEALGALAREAREDRARGRQEAAARAAPKIQLVVALLLVPAVLLLVAAAIAPALLSAA